MRLFRSVQSPRPSGNNPQSIQDKFISLVVSAITILQFFGISGEDVVNWIIKVISWIYHHGTWLIELAFKLF